MGGAAPISGSGLKDSAADRFGMAPWGEVHMIVEVIGLNAGFIRQNVYMTIILMSLLTTIATPLILRQLLGRDHP